MKLDLTQIKSLTVGAIDVVQEGEFYRFFRFTQRQREVFFASNGGKWDYDTTGIRVDFHTDATTLVLETGSSGKYEILVNDLTTYFDQLDRPANIQVDLDGTDNRVTIVLPNHSEGLLRNITLKDATYCHPHCYSRKIAFYGDSITQGWNSEKDSQTYAWILTRALDAHSMNFGVGGTTFIPDIPEDIGYQADIVFVALGTNDYGRDMSLDTIRHNCASYLKQISTIYPNSKLFCITPTWRRAGVNPKAAGTLADVRAAIHEIAEEQGYIVINGLDMLPHLIEYFSDGGLHPNDLGFAHYAWKLYRAIAPYL